MHWVVEHAFPQILAWGRAQEIDLPTCEHRPSRTREFCNRQTLGKVANAAHENWHPRQVGDVVAKGYSAGRIESDSPYPDVPSSREMIQEKLPVLTSLFLLLLAVIAVAIAMHLNRRARLRNLRGFAATAGRTLQIDTCGGIKTTNLHTYLCALASAFRTQAMLRDLELRPGEFKQAVTDAIESAYLLKKDPSRRETARGALLLFASCMDAVMSGTLTGEAAHGDEGNFVGIAGAVTLLASVGWHPEANADLVTCALSGATLGKEPAEYWRTSDQAQRVRVEAAFERAIRTALDPATAAYVRHKVFSDFQGVERTAVDIET